MDKRMAEEMMDKQQQNMTAEISLLDPNLAF